jgi:hypothetical protein
VRGEATREKILRFAEELGRAAKTRGRVYLTGGATAVLMGWRASTIDVDLKMLPEPEGAFEAIARLKNALDLNIELASPDDFIPPLPDWEAQSVLVGTFGAIELLHYDLRAQALSKIERGHEQDLRDVRDMLERGLVTPDQLRAAFARIEPGLVRYPSIEPEVFRTKLDALLAYEAKP